MGFLKGWVFKGAGRGVSRSSSPWDCIGRLRSQRSLGQLAGASCHCRASRWVLRQVVWKVPPWKAPAEAPFFKTSSQKYARLCWKWRPAIASCKWEFASLFCCILLMLRRKSFVFNSCNLQKVHVPKKACYLTISIQWSKHPVFLFREIRCE